MKFESNALSNFPHQQDHGHLPKAEPRPQLAVSSQEGLEEFQLLEVLKTLIWLGSDFRNSWKNTILVANEEFRGEDQEY